MRRAWRIAQLSSRRRRATSCDGLRDSQICSDACSSQYSSRYTSSTSSSSSSICSTSSDVIPMSQALVQVGAGAGVSYLASPCESLHAPEFRACAIDEGSSSCKLCSTSCSDVTTVSQALLRLESTPWVSYFASLPEALHAPKFGATDIDVESSSSSANNYSTSSSNVTTMSQALLRFGATPWVSHPASASEALHARDCHVGFRAIQRVRVSVPSSSRGGRSVSSVFALRDFVASYSTAATAAEVKEVDFSTTTGPTLLEIPQEEEQGGGETLSHVADLEGKLRCLRNWGLTDKDLAKLQLHLPSSIRSAMLNNSAKKLEEVACFLAEECGMPQMKVADALLRNVFLASSSVDEYLKAKVEYLKSLGITKDQLAKLIARCPQLLSYSMELRVEKLVEVGLRTEDIGKVVVKHPGLLGTGIGKIDGIVEFLRAAGVVEVSKCILRHPQILSLSLTGKVHAMTAFLKSELLLSSAQINRTISIQPSIFTYSVESNLLPKVLFFQELGFAKQEIGRMVALHPAIMGHSLEVAIKPKIHYLLNVMKRELDEIASFPQYLSYSLPGRIQPRFEILGDRARLISLSSMLSCGKETFARRYVKSPKPMPLTLSPTSSK